MNFDKLKPKIVNIIKSKLSLHKYRIFLFGSRINGTGSERSDIDIGIEAKEKIEVTKIDEIKEALEKIPTLKKFDVIDFKDVGDDFRKVALKKIEVLYDRKI